MLPFLLVFKSATLNNIIVEGVNGAWSRFELAAHRDAALNAGAASLDAMRAPNVLVSAPNSEIAPWMQRKLADALAAENQALGGSARVRFSNVAMVPRRQVFELVGDFTVDDPRHHAKIDGYLVGDGVLTSDGTSVTVKPQVVALHVSQIRFDRGVPFATKPVIEDMTALLTGVRDGVNQRWPAYRLAIPLRPLGAPGRPVADLTLDLRDPFDPSRTIATVVSPPTVRALAFVLDDRRLALMGEVTLDSGAAAPRNANGRATYAGLNDGFKRLAADAGLDASPSRTYQLKSDFQDALLARYLAPVFTRDRLRPAVRQSMAALERPGPVDLGLSVALPVAQSVFKSKVTAALDASAARADLTVKSTSFSTESQSLSAVILATAPIPALSTRGDVALRVQAPITSGESGVALYPQIDTLVVTHLDTAAFGDLQTLLGGASDALARSVGEINAALPPEPLGLSDVAIPSLGAGRWAAPAQGVSVSANSAAPSVMTFADLSVLVAGGRILAVGHAVADQGTAVAEPVTTTMDGSFPAYRSRFLSTWTSSFGAADAGAPAVAYISKRSIAAYVSATWNDAHVGWRYQGGASEGPATPVLVSALPTSHCRPGAPAAACAAATPVLAQAVKQTVGADGFQLGMIKSRYATRVSVEATDSRLGLSPNLTGALLTANAGGEAHGALAMQMDGHSVAGQSACPADQHWRLPLDSGAYRSARTSGTRIRVASSLEPRADGGDALRLRLSSGALSVETRGRAMQGQILSGVAGDVVRCPVAGLIAAAPGASEALKSAELTPATARMPDVMTKSMQAVRGGGVRDALDGRARHTFVLKTLDIEVDLPTFRALDAGYGATSSLEGDWVKTVAKPRVGAQASVAQP